MSDWIQIGDSAYNMSLVTDVYFGADDDTTLLYQGAEQVGSLRGDDNMAFRTWWQTEIATRHVRKIVQKEGD